MQDRNDDPPVPPERLRGLGISVESPPTRTLGAVAGLETRKRRLRESVIDPARTDRHDRLGASGLLIYGPSGVGKTHLAEAIAGELRFDYVAVTPTDLPLENADRTARCIESVTEFARSVAPCVLFLDDFDAIAPANGEHEFGRPSQVGTALKTALDTIDSADENVVVVATATHLSGVERTVRRSGRIDILMQLDDSGQQRRRQLFRSELDAVASRVDGLDIARADIDLDLCTELTSGLVAAEILNGIQRAAQIAVADARPDRAVLTQSALIAAFEAVAQRKGRHERPTDTARDDGERDSPAHTGPPHTSPAVDAAPRTDTDDSSPADAETQSDRSGQASPERAGAASSEGGVVDSPVGTASTPATTYDDIGGLDDAKQRLREAVEWPLRHAEMFDRLDIDPPTGILLYGPPGTGKTMLAKAAANGSDRSFIAIDGPEVFDKHFGESERFVRDLFDAARDAAPAMIFFDEFDSIAGQRGGYTSGSDLKDSIVNQLLSELDGTTGLDDVVVVAATNRPEMIDPALRRPGRFGLDIEINNPGATERSEILNTHLRDRSLANDVDIEWVASRLDDRYSGADVAAVCQRAAMATLRRVKDEHADPPADGDDALISRADFERAVASVDPSGEATPDAASRYSFW